MVTHTSPGREPTSRESGGGGKGGGGEVIIIITVEPPNKGHLGTRASVLYSEVRNVLAL